MDFVKFLLSQYFTWYFIIFISRELLISRTPIKNTIFWKSMTRSFKWIKINCFNVFRFFPEVSTNFKKMHYFGQFKNHNSGKKNIKLYKWHHFFDLLFEFLPVIFIFVFENCRKFIFMGFSFRPFWSSKYLNFGGVSCKIRILSRSIQETHTLRKVKSQVLLFLSSWEPNLFDLMVYFCLFQNAILQRVEAHEILSQFFSECSFHWLQHFFSTFGYMSELKFIS